MDIAKSIDQLFKEEGSELSAEQIRGIQDVVDESLKNAKKLITKCIARHTKFALKQLAAETVLMQNSQDLVVALGILGGPLT